VLEGEGFEVLRVDTRQLAQVPGRNKKSDLVDCQWIQRLHRCGLLKGSFRPPAEVQEVHRYFTGEDLEPYEMVYFKLFENQLPIIERALYVASRLAGTERSRGFCLELVCADFLAGRTEESSPEETLLVIQRLASLVPPEYLARVVSQLQSCAAT
jgi:hypothetical protein